MSHSQILIHCRYVRVGSCRVEHQFTFAGKAYALKFDGPGIHHGQGFILESLSGSRVPIALCQLLTVYFGEDAMRGEQGVDSRFIFTRGTFEFSARDFDRFARTFARWPRTSDPKWKRALFDLALIHYAAGIAGGFNWMPLSLGYFALSLECVGNLLYGSRSHYFTLGQKRFLRLLDQRLMRLKLQPGTKQVARAFGHAIKEDVDLLNVLRNAFYGHSTLHIRDDARQLVNALNKWMKRHGVSRQLQFRSVDIGRIRDNMAVEAPALYKMGLRTARLFLFMMMGYRPDRIPFASHDFMVTGDLRAGEPLIGPDGTTFRVGTIEVVHTPPP